MKHRAKRNSRRIAAIGAGTFGLAAVLTAVGTGPASADLGDPNVTVSGTAVCPPQLIPQHVTFRLQDGEVASADFDALGHYTVNFHKIPVTGTKGTAAVHCIGAFHAYYDYVDHTLNITRPLSGNKTQRDLSQS